MALELVCARIQRVGVARDDRRERVDRFDDVGALQSLGDLGDALPGLDGEGDTALPRPRIVVDDRRVGERAAPPLLDLADREDADTGTQRDDDDRRDDDDEALAALLPAPAEESRRIKGKEQE